MELNTLTVRNKTLVGGDKGRQGTKPRVHGGMVIRANVKSPEEELWLSSVRIWAKGRSWRTQIKLFHYQNTSSPLQAGLFLLGSFFHDEVEFGLFLPFPLRLLCRNSGNLLLISVAMACPHWGPHLGQVKNTHLT